MALFKGKNFHVHSVTVHTKNTKSVKITHLQYDSFLSTPLPRWIQRIIIGSKHQAWHSSLFFQLKTLIFINPTSSYEEFLASIRLLLYNIRFITPASIFSKECYSRQYVNKQNVYRPIVVDQMSVDQLSWYSQGERPNTGPVISSVTLQSSLVMRFNDEMIYWIAWWLHDGLLFWLPGLITYSM